MADRSARRDLPRFDNPPVSETVYGVVFTRLPELKAPYLGLLWERYRSEYPKCDEVPRLLDTSQETFNQWITPRVWFLHNDDSRVIQVQDNRFFYNWRKREQAYPNYDVVFPEFRDKFEIFQSFLQDHNLGNIVPQSLELTYINHIPVGSGWTKLAEISQLLPDLGWRDNSDRFLPQPQNMSVNIGFLLPDGKGTLVATVQTGRRAPDGAPIIILQLSANGPPESNKPEEFSGWFDLAHEWIVQGFEDLTSVEVQREIWSKK